MDVHASLRHLRMAPRKVRLIVDAVRGLPVLAADTRLTFMPRAAALPVQKLLRSAMANAEHNFQLKKEDLMIKTITADGGPTIRRVRPRARGSAAPIRKRTTHVHIVLAPLSARVPKTASSARATKTA
jgi:large subunit ribosomal protein L22